MEFGGSWFVVRGSWSSFFMDLYNTVVLQYRNFLKILSEDLIVVANYEMRWTR